MEGDSGCSGREDAVGEDFRRSGERADVEDGREDGNLIPGEGIHVGKGRRVVEVPGYAGDVNSRPNANLEVEL